MKIKKLLIVKKFCPFCGSEVEHYTEDCKKCGARWKENGWDDVCPYCSDKCYWEKSELKTLKDIEYNKNRVFTDRLRKEAVKWVKDRISNCVFSCRNNHQRCKEHKFWMERFNITEADLKDGKSS